MTDIRIAGAAEAIQQYLRVGLVDEFTLALSPVMFGGGRRLFEGIGRSIAVELVNITPSGRGTRAPVELVTLPVSSGAGGRKTASVAVWAVWAIVSPRAPAGDAPPTKRCTVGE